jgi:hypothetical protein
MGQCEGEGEGERGGGTYLGLVGRLELGYEASVDARVGRLDDPTDLRSKLVDLLHRLRLRRLGQSKSPWRVAYLDSNKVRVAEGVSSSFVLVRSNDAEHLEHVARTFTQRSIFLSHTPKSATSLTR